MRIESAVTSVTWIPSEAVEGMPKLPFELGVAHYDEPPPDVLGDLEQLHSEGRIPRGERAPRLDRGQGRADRRPRSEGGGLLGVTRMRLGPARMAFPAVAFPLIQPEPEVGDGWVRFVQTAGGRMGLPAPRRVRGKPYFQCRVGLGVDDARADHPRRRPLEGSLVGASPFPRHWVYDDEGRSSRSRGRSTSRSGTASRYGENTPWGGEDTPAFVTAVETQLERELSESVMQLDAKLPRRRLDARGHARRARRGGRRPLRSPRRRPPGRGRRRDVAEVGPGRDPRRAGGRRGRASHRDAAGGDAGPADRDRVGADQQVRADRARAARGVGRRRARARCKRGHAVGQSSWRPEEHEPAARLDSVVPILGRPHERSPHGDDEQAGCARRHP